MGQHKIVVVGSLTERAGVLVPSISDVWAVTGGMIERKLFADDGLELGVEGKGD